MRPSFKDYFHFHSEQRKGVYALLGIIAALIIARELVYLYNSKQKPEDNEEIKELLNLLEAELADNSSPIEESTLNDLKEEEAISYFNFNPNNLPIEQWMKLGLSQRQAEIIKNYEAKGGKFRIKSDLAKIYTISEKQYQNLLPYIMLPESINLPSKEVSKKAKKTDNKEWGRIIVDINTADSSELRRVYGIGPFFSKRIVSYREELGGYHNKRQLLEIPNFSDSIYIALDSSLTLSKVSLVKININTATAQELKAHPYINWNIANSIIKIRQQHGQYQEVEDILQSELISDSIFSKISPYLSIE